MQENELRDLLATQIEVLESGLKLVDKEAYLPNPIGTKSFVDLLALDSTNRYVLVELKRTAAASREAIHEIYKYTEAAKAHLGTRDDEVRVLLVSTDWRELLVPFSRFFADTTITVKGLLLTLNEGRTLFASPINPVPFSNNRYIAPWHTLKCYHDASNLNRGIHDHEDYCLRNGIQDFVMVVLKASPDFNKDCQKSYKQYVEAKFDSVTPETEPTASEHFVLPTYDFILYFALRMMNRDEGLALIADSERRSAIEGYFESGNERGAMCHLHECLATIDPMPYGDLYEIGYPTKFRCKLLEDERWSIQEVRRYGTFARNKALSDESIIEELGGSDGFSNQSLESKLNVSDPSQMKVLREQLDQCLTDNPRWRAQITHVLEEILSERPDAMVDLQIANPCCGLLTLFLGVTRGVEYLPHYLIKVGDTITERLYIGFLEFDESTPQTTFHELLKLHYKGDEVELVRPLNWGGYDAKDTDVLENVGLFYRTARIDNPREASKALVLREHRWYPQKTQFHPFGDLAKYFRFREELMTALIVAVQRRWDGVLVDLSKQERPS